MSTQADRLSRLLDAKKAYDDANAAIHRAAAAGVLTSAQADEEIKLAQDTLDKAKLETVGGAQDHLARQRSTGSPSGHMDSPSKEGTGARGHNTRICPKAAAEPAQSGGSRKIQARKRAVPEPAGVAGVGFGGHGAVSQEQDQNEKEAEDRPQKRGRRAGSKNTRLTNLDALRLPTLRAICADLGLVTSGTKPEVMNRIQALKNNLDPLTAETLRLTVADRDKAFDKEWPGLRFVRRYSDGSFYMGEFGAVEADPNLGSVGGKRHGKGTMTCPTGSGEVRYEGEWRDSNMHGQGTYTWASGARYEGEWRDGNMHGQGTYTWAAGTGTRASGATTKCTGRAR